MAVHGRGVGKERANSRSIQLVALFVGSSVMAWTALQRVLVSMPLPPCAGRTRLRILAA